MAVEGKKGAVKYSKLYGLGLKPPHARAALLAYPIDGRPVFDMSRPADRAALDRIVSLPVTRGLTIPPGGLDQTIEPRDSLLERLRGLQTVTDDNMGTEWQ